MKYIINYLSILAGRSFAKSWNSAESRDNQRWITLKKLEIYVALRRRLPKVLSIHDNNHEGNNYRSSKKPYWATQGF
jgi:hypothetical protein